MCCTENCESASLVPTLPGDVVESRVTPQLGCEAAEACAVHRAREGGCQKVQERNERTYDTRYFSGVTKACTTMVDEL